MRTSGTTGLHRHGGTERGFTLLELMVVVIVLALLLAIALPTFEATINNNRLAGASNELMASIQTARMEAVRRNQRAAVCLSDNAKSAAPTCATSDINGWITFVDANKNGTFNAGDTLLRTASIPGKVEVHDSTNIAGSISFRSDGFARTSAGDLLFGAIDLCIDTTHVAKNVRHVIIGAGSRVSISSAKIPGTCQVPSDKP